jgi:hypothetical protein
VEKYGRAIEATDGNITGRIHFACCKTKVTNTHLEYAMPIAFPPQKWLRERASILRYADVACFVLHGHVSVGQICIAVGNFVNNFRKCYIMCLLIYNLRFRRH